METLPDSFFRDLDPTEVKEFKQWARENFHPLDEIEDVWHPIIKSECLKIRLELGSVIATTEQ